MLRSYFFLCKFSVFFLLRLHSTENFVSFLRMSSPLGPIVVAAAAPAASSLEANHRQQMDGLRCACDWDCSLDLASARGREIPEAEISPRRYAFRWAYDSRRWLRYSLADSGPGSVWLGFHSATRLRCSLPASVYAQKPPQDVEDSRAIKEPYPSAHRTQA